ncbi:MAG: hypothetical protein IJZ25_00275 [Lachnospiraceae bacterium]|nr:hypothetical protein [Lachnospiraceae bacterium]
MEKIEFQSKWYEEQEEEIRKESFKYAKDTVKKGDPIDFLSCFCGIFALACFAIVLYFGIKNGISDSMLLLLPIYVLIAFFSLCRPLQIKISQGLWNSGFEKRIAVNKGYDGTVTVTEEDVRVTGKKGEEVYAMYSDCFFFETDNFIVLNITDHKMFPVAKTELEESGNLDELLKLCINEDEKKEQTDSKVEGNAEEPAVVVTEEQMEEVTEESTEKQVAEVAEEPTEKPIETQAEEDSEENAEAVSEEQNGEADETLQEIQGEVSQDDK